MKKVKAGGAGGPPTLSSVLCLPLYSSNILLSAYFELNGRAPKQFSNRLIKLISSPLMLINARDSSFFLEQL